MQDTKDTFLLWPLLNNLFFSLQLWFSPGRGALLPELDRLELALPLLLPKEHLPRQARRTH